MVHVIDPDGLPDPVAKAIVETVVNLENRYTAQNAGSPAASSQKLSPQEADAALDEVLASLPPMPGLSDKALSRESIYASDDEAQ